MSGLQTNTVGKVAAALLLLVTAFVGALFGFQVLISLSLSESDSWQENARFYDLLQNRQSDVTSCYTFKTALETDQTLTYMDRQHFQDSIQMLESTLNETSTWFRYQVKSGDGERVLFTNLQKGESLAQVVETVHYASFVPGDDAATKDQFWYQDELTQTPVNSESLIIECGVPSDVTNGSIQDEFSRLAFDHLDSKANFSPRLTGFLLLFGLCLACLLYLLWTAGHKAGIQSIVLTWQDKIFFDIYAAFMIAVGTAALAGILSLGDYCTQYNYCLTGPSDHYFSLLVLSACALSTLLVAIITLTLRTLAVRLKAHALIRTTLTFRLIGWCWQTARAFVRSLPLTWRLIVGFLIYLVLELIAWQLRYSFGSLLLLGANIMIFLALCWWTVCFHRLRTGSQAIAAGNLNHQIDTFRLPHDLKLCAEDLNNISVGLSSAVNEKMKSERFKAELITNVSHDLKTPLTSIINYVNLLKCTEQSDSKALEYIEVLDRKSQRLKKLTEDLVEASKASTGVLSVNREKIGMAQLIDQALGEWEEKLEARKLTVVASLPEGETWVYADGRHLWRVIDNLLSNCAKYAMEGTRIYLDLNRGKGHVVFSVKNISRDALNLPAERLLERFVRGEESRTTEGSGLGLSIARSLTELQGGVFELTVDGDLFKATVTLPQAN